MEVEIKGTVTEAAIKKATAMLNQIGIQPNPKPVSNGSEEIVLHTNNGNPYVAIRGRQGYALVWKTKERRRKK